MVESRRALPSFSRLRYPQILLNSCTHRPAGGNGFDLPSYIPYFLAAIISENRQESLTFLDFSTRWEMDPATDETAAVSEVTLVNPDQGWKEVDDTLSNRELFPKLQCVRMLCASRIIGLASIGEPTQEQRVALQVQMEVATALHRTNATVATLAVGAEGTAATERACSLATSLVPEKYKPAGRFRKLFFMRAC